MINLTYNTKLVFFQPEDNQKLINILKTHRDAFNECSQIKFDQNIENSIVLLHSAFYRQYRNKNPNIPAQVAIRAEQECLSSYRSIKSNKHTIEKPVSKKKLSMRLDHNLFTLKKDGSFTISSLEKRVKCKPLLYPKLEEFWQKYEFCDPLIFERNGEVYISITFEVPTTFSKEPKLALGIDLGIRCYAATSEGNLYQDKKFNGEKRKLRFLKRKLRSKLDSTNSKAAKRHLNKLRRKERNKNKNFLFHLANAILKNTKANVIVLENLKSLKVKKHKYQNKNRISQVSFFLLKQILTYKAHLSGKQVETVCPSYTSQIDSRTEKREGERRGCRFYGKDGKILHADVNAAINIAVRSKLPVSCVGSANATYGQAAVNSPIVGKSKDFSASS